MAVGLLLLLALVANTAVDNQSRDANEVSFYGEPHYSLQVHTSDPYVDMGDEFQIELFISGAGDVALSKIHVDIPGVIVEKGTVKLKILNYELIDPLNMTVSGTIEERNEDSRFYILPPSIMYMLPANKSNLAPIPMIFGECTYQINETEFAPYTINFKIADTATPGDYEILLDYIYKYSDKWYQDTKIVKLHLNQWYETEFWEKFLQIGAALAVILTLILLLKEIWPFLKSIFG